MLHLHESSFYSWSSNVIRCGSSLPLDGVVPLLPLYLFSIVFTCQYFCDVTLNVSQHIAELAIAVASRFSSYFFVDAVSSISFFN